MLGATGATAALGGCDPAMDALSNLLASSDPTDFRPPDAAEIDATAHVLSRLTWGAPPGEYRRVHALGVDAFVEEQLRPDDLPDRRCAWKVASLESIAEPTGELYDHDPRQLRLDLTRAKLIRGVYSRRQLYEVMVDFWSDHLNIVLHKGHCKWLKAADDRDVVRTHAMGRFRDLIRASVVSPAMLIYLDGHANKVERPGDRPNENYARELLELHTLGVHGGYEQRDVMEIARCLSGWTYAHEPLALRPAHVAFDPSRHDAGAKSVLGHVIPAGGGADDLERVLDIVCAHPATARHVATKLGQRFVDDPAPPAAVETTTAAFLDSDGDIRATLRALFASEDFRETRGNLFKRPLRFVVGGLRATGAKTNCGPPVIEYLERMGQLPFQYPSPDGYPLEAQPWLGTLLWRWNLALAVQHGDLKGTTVASDALETQLGGRAGLAAHLLGRVATPRELELLDGAPAPLALLLSSPAFQRF